MHASPNRLSTWIAPAAIGLLFIIPFILTFALGLPGKVFPSFGFKWLALAVGIMAIALIPYISNSKDGIRIPYVILIPIGLTFIAIYQAVANDIPYLSPYLNLITCLIWAAGLTTLGATLARHADLEQVVTVIAWMAMLGGLISSLIGLLQIVGVPNAVSTWVMPHERHMPIGNVGHVNYFTAHATLSLLALIALFGLKKITLQTFLAVLLVFASVLAFAPSRTIYLYFFFVLLWTAWTEYKSRTKEAKRLFLGMGLSLAAFLVLHLWLPAFAEQLLNTNFNTALNRVDQFNEEGQFFSRIDAWRVSLQLFLEHPMLGVGTGEFPWHHFQQAESGKFGVFDHPHNLILFFMATTGIAGTFMVTTALYQLSKKILSVTHLPVFWLPASMLLVIMIYSMLEFPLWLPAFLGITAFLSGLLLPAGWQFNASTIKLKLLFGFGIVFAAYLLFDTLKDYQRLNNIDKGYIKAEMVDAEARIALRNPWLRPYADQLFVSGNITSTQAIQARLQMNSRLMRWNPTERILARQIILLSMTGQEETALKLFDKATRLNEKYLPKMLKFCHQRSLEELNEVCAAAKAKSSNDSPR